MLPIIAQRVKLAAAKLARRQCGRSRALDLLAGSSGVYAQLGGTMIYAGHALDAAVI